MQNLTILRERCSDPALSVRKQALQSLTDLLDVFPQNKDIQKCVIYSNLNTGTHVTARPSLSGTHCDTAVLFTRLTCSLHKIMRNICIIFALTTLVSGSASVYDVRSSHFQSATVKQYERHYM